METQERPHELNKINVIRNMYIEARIQAEDRKKAQQKLLDAKQRSKEAWNAVTTASIARGTGTDSTCDCQSLLDAAEQADAVKRDATAKLAVMLTDEVTNYKELAEEADALTAFFRQHEQAAIDMRSNMA